MDPYNSDRAFVAAWLDYLDMFLGAMEHPDRMDMTAAEKLKISIEEKEADAARRGYMPVTYRLRTIFRLSDFFWKCVLLSVAGDLDISYGERIAGLQGDLTRTIPQVSLALKLFVPRRRIVQLMMGSFRRPDALEGIVSCPDSSGRLAIAGFYDAEIELCCQAMAHDPGDCTTILCIFGADFYLRKRILMESYLKMGFTAYFLDMRRLNLADMEQCRHLLDQVIFEALMNSAVVCVDWPEGDRSANAETAFLLQQIEDYEGITILATNHVNNIILINSAFLAASEGTCIDNEHLVRATCSFYKKSGRVMAPHEFGPYGYVMEDGKGNSDDAIEAVKRAIAGYDVSM